MTGITTGQTSLPTATDSDDNEGFLTGPLTTALQTLANLFESATGHDHTGAGKGKPIGAGGLAVASVTSDKLSMSTAGQALGADVTISVAGTYVTAVSVSLVAGTWILSGYATVRGPTIGSVEATVQLTDGTTTFASAEATTGAASRLVPFALSPVVVTPGTTTTYSLRATTDAGTDGLVKATTPANGALSNATRITAVRIG